jgi:hypothetical protein
MRAGEDGSALEIAKIYVKSGTPSRRIVGYLRKVAESETVDEFDQEEAKKMLKEYSSPRGRAAKRKSVSRTRRRC